MRFLRRGVGSATAEPGSSLDAAPQQPDPAARTPSKGRPTPKRSEAELRRRGPVAPPPRNQREAYRRSKTIRGGKAERRTEAADRRARMMAGDERYLLPRDRGPARAYVRDLVDARRNLAGLFMPLAVLVFVSVLLPIPAIQTYASLVTLCLLAGMVIEGIMLGRYVSARVRERFPKENLTGWSIGWYAFTRATQPRRFRVPKPRVQRGATPA